jgi:invasion protein IalB
VSGAESCERAAARHFVDSVRGIVHLPRRKIHPFSEIVTMNMVRIAVSAFAISAASIVGAYAADTKDAPPPVGTEPQNTSATYGDWTLRCSRTGEADKTVRVCEVMLPFQLQGQQAPFAQLAIGHVNPKDPMHATFLVSPNVAFPSNVKLSADDKDAQPVELSWSTCIAAACRADGEFKDDQLKKWKAFAAPARLQFKDSTGRELAIPISVRGLAQALDALAKS